MLSRHPELAKAFTYTLNQWATLIYHASDGWTEADNIIAENALRTVSLGRKNCLFLGSDQGGERGFRELPPSRVRCHRRRVGQSGR